MGSGKIPGVIWIKKRILCRNYREETIWCRKATQRRQRLNKGCYVAWTILVGRVHIEKKMICSCLGFTAVRRNLSFWWEDDLSEPKIKGKKERKEKKKNMLEQHLSVLLWARTDYRCVWDISHCPESSHLLFFNIYYLVLLKGIKKKPTKKVLPETSTETSPWGSEK